MNTPARIAFAAAAALTGMTLLGGCIYREKAVPAASPPTTVIVSPPAAQRVVNYPDGRYELRGDGTVASPYVWVWIPAGANPPNPPPLPSVR